VNIGYRIVEAERGHLAALPGIELAAATLLAGHAPGSVLDETTEEQTFRQAQHDGRLWVAVSRGAPIGFALVEMLADAHSHLQEIDVLPDEGRRGVGSALLETVLLWARRSGHVQTTLTTFRAPPLNMPFYRKFGFHEIGASEWSAPLARIVAAEAGKGLPQETRCVMRFRHERTSRSSAVPAARSTGG